MSDPNGELYVNSVLLTGPLKLVHSQANKEENRANQLDFYLMYQISGAVLINRVTLHAVVGGLAADDLIHFHPTFHLNLMFSCCMCQLTLIHHSAQQLNEVELDETLSLTYSMSTCCISVAFPLHSLKLYNCREVPVTYLTSFLQLKLL